MKRLKPIERSKDCAYRERLNLLCIAAAVLNSGASTQFLALHRSTHVRLSQLIQSNLSLSQLFSALLTTLLSLSQQFSALRASSQHISILINLFQLNSFDLFPPPLKSSRHFSPLLNACPQCSPPPTFCQLCQTLLKKSHLC